MKQPITIAVADDHQLMLEGLASLIDSIEGLSLVAKVHSGKALLSFLNDTNRLPDLCIVDIEMPELDGIETVKRIRSAYPKMKVMVLTMHHESHFISRMIAAGANGYLLKNVGREVFIQSIEKIMSSDNFVMEGLERQQKITHDEDALTQREKQILQRIVLGKSNKEIAEELFISDRTADTHRTNIKRKLKCSTLAQLIQYAKANDLMPL